MQSLSRYQFIDEQRATRARQNALLTKLAGDRMIAALDRLGEVLAKGGYDPEQPRLPEGVTGGGRWSDGSGQQPAAIPLLSDFLAVFPDAIAGAAGGLELPALSSPPVIPLNKPASAEHVTAVVRGSAEWLQSAKETGKSTQGRAFFN